jgi:hypothetical protein
LEGNLDPERYGLALVSRTFHTFIHLGVDCHIFQNFYMEILPLSWRFSVSLNPLKVLFMRTEQSQRTNFKVDAMIIRVYEHLVQGYQDSHYCIVSIYFFPEFLKPPMF